MSDIRTDDQVVTSGVDGIYPKGLLIGQVESFQLGVLDFTEIVIRPAVDFSSLEHVLIIVTPLVTTNFEDAG
jgi:rod shape-determining protein MreC